MNKGKILIVDMNTGKVFGWFGENDESRPAASEIGLLELEANEYEDQFSKFRGTAEDVTVVDFEGKKLSFKTMPSLSTL